MEFKQFLLNENREYLGLRVGDILNAIQDLNSNIKNMGTRQVVKNGEAIVNQIRRILHSNWNKEEESTLKSLQKVGVALAKTLEDKDDLEGTIAAAQQELEELSSDLGVPANQLGTPEEDEDAPTTIDTEAPPQGQEEEEQAGRTVQPPRDQQQPMMPPPSGMAPPFGTATPGGI